MLCERRYIKTKLVNVGVFVCACARTCVGDTGKFDEEEKFLIQNFG